MHAPVTLSLAPRRPEPFTPWTTTGVGWRFETAHIPCHELTVCIGGPLLAVTTYALSQACNQRARAEAERLAAPRWRTLGALDIVVEADRLLVHHDGEWAIVWLGSVTHVVHHPDRPAVGLHFTDDPPYWIDTPDAAALAAHIRQATDGTFDDS
jgi:hypothetical protein